jgi:hypothetical protein
MLRTVVLVAFLATACGSRGGLTTTTEKSVPLSAMRALQDLVVRAVEIVAKGAFLGYVAR